MFRLLSDELEAAEGQRTLTFDQTPVAIAEGLVRLVAQGAEANFWRRLHTESDRAEAALAELAALYLHVADRSAAEWFALAGFDAATRDLFFGEMVAQTLSGLQTLTGAKLRHFSRLLERRRSEYGRCRELARTGESTLDGTVIYAFYKHALALGTETALLVMSELNLAEVEDTVITALADIVDRPADLNAVAN